MPKPPEFDTTAAHRYYATHCFNDAWSLIDSVDRSPDEERELVALGHASFWHWTQRSDCTNKNLSVAHWLLSRIYAVLRDPGPAQRYAESCLAISQRPDVEPFYLAWAYEAVARSAAIRADWTAASGALQQARTLANQVSDSKSRKVLLTDLGTIPDRRVTPESAN